MTSEEFESLVVEALDGLPAELASQMNNVQVVVQDTPDPDDLDEGDDAGNLLGLYQGVPLTERDGEYFGVLPDRITLYKQNLERAAATPEELREVVRETVIHEIAHHFGIDDDRLEELGWD